MKKLNVLLVISALMSGFSLTAPAMALAPCGEVVVDDANLLSPSDESRIATAAAELAAVGATVRVRTSADLGSYSTMLEAVDSVCASSWGGDKLVFWVTSVSRDVGIYAGSAWAEEITPSVTDRLIDEHMMSALQSESFANAFIRAIGATTTLLAPTPVVTPQVVVTQSERAGDPIVINQTPAANEWSFATVKAVLTALLALVGGLLWWRYHTNERSRKDKIARTRQAAVLVSNQCVELIKSFNEFDERLTKQLASLKDVLAESTVAEFSAQLEILHAEAKMANDEFNGHNDPASGGNELGWYEASLASTNQSKVRLEEISKAFQALESDMVQVAQMAAAMPERHLTLLKDLTFLQKNLDVVAAAGFKIEDLQNEFNDQKAVLKEVEALILRKLHAQANAMITAAADAAARIVKAAEALPVRKGKLTDRLQNLRHILTDMPKLQKKASADFASIEATYAEVSYASVVGNETESLARNDEAKNLLDIVPGLIAEQKFDEAEKVLDQAEELLTEATTLLEVISSLEERLSEAKVDSQDELVEAKRSIIAAEAYLNQYDEVTRNRYRAKLVEAQDLCIQVAKLLMADKPDYLEVFALATKADRLADDVLKDAQDEREQAERQKRQAEIDRKQAIQAAVAAQQYVRNHHRDVDESVRRDAESMSNDINQLRNHSDVSTVISVAQSILQRSAIIQREAELDFRAAETRRESMGSTQSWGSTRSSSPSIGSSKPFVSQSPSSSSGSAKRFTSSAPSRPKSVGSSKKF